MPRTLKDLFSNPEYQALSYESQQRVKRRYFDEVVMPSEQYTTLPDASKQNLFYKIMDTAPAISGLGGIELTPEERDTLSRGEELNQPIIGDYKKAVYLHDAALAGDEKAQKQIRYFVAGKTIENQSMLMQLALGATDLLDGKDGPSYLSQNKKELDKMADYLKSAVTRSEGENIAALQTAVTIGTQIAEAIPLNALLIGQAGGRAGLLTKGIFTSLEKSAASMLPGVGRTLTKSLVPAGVEAVGEGLTEILRSLPTMLNNGNITGNQELFTNMAQNFGEGVVADLGLYYAGKTVLHVVKPFMNSFRKIKLTDADGFEALAKNADLLDEENFPKLMNAVTSGKIDQALIDMYPEASRKDVIKLINKTATMAKTPSIDFNTPEGFEKYAMLAQHDVDFVDGKIVLSQFDQPKFTASSYREAGDYISNYLKTTNGETYMADLSNAVRASAPEATLRVETTSKFTADKLPTKALASTLKPDYQGNINLKNVKTVSETFLNRAKAVDAQFDIERVADFATFQRRASQFSGNRILVPAKLQTADELKAFGNYYNQKLTQLTKAYNGDVSLLPAWDSVQSGISSFDTATPASLQSMVTQFGGKLDINGSAWTLTAPGNAPQIFHSAREAERAVADFRVAALGVDEAEVTQYLAKSGKTVKKELNPNVSTPESPIYAYNVYGHGGIIESSEDTLDALVTKHPQYMPKLPAYLTPEMSFVGKSNKVRIVGDLMYGNEQDIRKALDSYSSNDAKLLRHVEHAVSKNVSGEVTGEIMESASNRYVLEVPELGFRKTFKSTKEATEFLSKDLGSFDTLEELANERGIRLSCQKSGEITAIDNTGKTTLVRSSNDLKKLLAEYPDPEGASEFIGYNNSFITDDLVQQASEVAQKDFQTLYSGTQIPVTETKKALDTVLSYTVPMNDTLQNIAKSIGKSEIPDDVLVTLAKTNPALAKRLEGFNLTKAQNGINASHHLEAVEGRKAEAIMEKFLRLGGKQLDKNERTVIAKLMEVSENQWAQAAKNLGVELTSEHVRLLKNTKTFLDYYGKTFGINLNEMFSNYAPRIRKTLRELTSDPKLQEQFIRGNKQQIIHSLFGAEPEALKTVEFFARHGRLEAFLGDATDTDIVRSLKYYIDNGMHEKYSRAIIEDTKEWFKHLEEMPNVTAEQTTIINSWFAAVSGEALRGGDLLISSTSNAVTHGIAKWMRTQSNKLTPTSNIGKAFDAMADELDTRGALEMMNSAVTYATLGARPLRGLYNMMQFNNTVGVYGRYADDAMREFMSGNLFDLTHANELVRRYMDQGIITDKVFASGHTRPKVQEGLLEMSMRNQQNSEFWTRAATALTIEKNFDDVFPYYARGEISAKKFLAESNIEFLDEGMQKEVMQLIADGKPESAKHLYQTEGVRILMGDYDASNYPMSFKGAVGKLFGRFGVYPINQIAMYKRMATQGSLAKKILRGARFLTVTTATYEAFKMAGMNYTGFLATDAFTFSGGPLFQLGQNILNSKPLASGEQDLQTKLARQEVLSSWRLMVPFSSQANKLLDAYESGSNGEIHKALIEVLSGSYTAESLLTPMVQ